MDTLFCMRVFSRVVEAGSFSVAADHLQCSKGTVSRAVSFLEIHLRTRLLQRTTRRLSLTEPGQRYYDKCRRILAELDHAEAEAAGAVNLAQGTLRVHCSPDLGRERVTHTIVEYRRRYPHVKVHARFQPDATNLIEDGVDVSILTAPRLPDSGNVSKMIGQMKRVLVAVPNYLETHRIGGFDDLNLHALTPIPGHAKVSGHRRDNGLLKPAERGAGGPFVINDVEATRFAVLAGAGVAALPLYCVSDDLHKARLVQVFPEYRLQSTPVCAIYASRQYLDAKIKTFVDFLASHFGAALQSQLPDDAARASHSARCPEFEEV